MNWQWVFDAADQFSKNAAFATLMSGAFGAFFGAVGAQVITSRYQTKQSVVAELNNVRAALMLCFSICNRFVALKRQLVLPMRNRYVHARQEYDLFKEQAQVHVGPARLVYELPADFRTISPVTLPSTILERQLFEKISISGRALAAAVDLLGAFDGLKKSIGDRNDLIAELHKRSPLPAKELTELYFGITTADGATDARFSATVENIFRQTDDCILFSRLLAGDLTDYGRRLRRRYAWRYRLRVPKFVAADWSIAERQGLMPEAAEYPDWLRGFKTRTTWFGRAWAWLRLRISLAMPKRS